MKPQVGILQGRLSPPIGNAIQAFPRDTWEREFALARKTGLDYIEWIFDREDTANPLMSEAGRGRLRTLIKDTGVQVPSLCADYFMSQPLLRGTIKERQMRGAKLEQLIEKCTLVGVRRMILPFVDDSAIEDRRQMNDLVHLMQSLLPTLARHEVEIHLETSLPPAMVALLMERMGSPWIKINYDTGNSASLGYAPMEEFAAYGRWIGSVHIKDRLRNGGTVPPGQGQTDFRLVASLLRKEAYAGSYTLQVARGETGDEGSWAIRHLAFWRAHLEASEHGSGT